MLIADSTGPGFALAAGIKQYLAEKCDCDVPLINVEKKTFKDGEFKLKISDNIRRKKCFLIHDSNKLPCDWLAELAFALEAMTFSSPEEINVVLPYLRFARQERKDESRISVNAKVVADIVSLYATRGITVDLHAPQVQEYFQIPFDNLYSFPMLIYYLKEFHPEILENLVVVSPDLGGGKRAEALAKRLQKIGVNAEIAFGHKTKVRDNEVEKVMIIGDVCGKNCLVVDDIIDTGGTMIKTAEVLRNAGAKTVYAYGTHGLFTQGTDRFKVFDKVIVSDTLKSPEGSNVEVLSLVGLFGEAIYRIVRGESLSVLFDK